MIIYVSSRAARIVAIFAFLGWLTSAKAITVPYSVGDWTGQFAAPTPAPAGAPLGAGGYPGDVVTFTGTSGSFNLVSGTSLLSLGTLALTIYNTYGGTATDWSEADWQLVAFDFTGYRTLSIGSASGTLGQSGSLATGWSADAASLITGPTIIFNLPGYNVAVTPQAVGPLDGWNVGDTYQLNIVGKFTVTQSSVPDTGSTLALLGSALIGLMVWGRKFEAAQTV